MYVLCHESNLRIRDPGRGHFRLGAVPPFSSPYAFFVLLQDSQNLLIAVGICFWLLAAAAVIYYVE
jgi:hypothetical protein